VGEINSLLPRDLGQVIEHAFDAQAPGEPGQRAHSYGDVFVMRLLTARDFRHGDFGAPFLPVQLMFFREAIPGRELQE
jgi:hypothetical protein